ncbi:glutathione S-transferase-like protein [Novosphingobium aromaticivorans DSM 12444]|uniref:Glutathione S-transferase-like protein n=1 Tax=Novosphingobium aromaticivorans (strain ATCC 700278 / DSM 12444 / CCUG 56034 / CIP 105152 / NBRC 16084 / F199) TaxID=279238 RepID=Q2G6U0_NOVAD|nr:glutathione S-transferase N-terminal domain-containing protein [Novosphingobium aromaticivorans]ABD26433.1 glutathione S-transferase-like protein [Novosphingobium aromaticivorans DSM 12444]SCY77921.1 glutathione S-transferase [Novosphingobium aromaticivorans]
MITLWGRLNSHNVKKVAWALIEMDLPHQRRDIGGQFGYTTDYLAKNPNRMVPMIEEGELALWESNAILRYLADRHAPAFRSDDPVVRAQGDKWMDWQFHFADAQRDAFLGCVRHGKDASDPAVATSATAAAGMMAILDEELARRPWLSGDRFGIADIPMGVYAHTYHSLPIERPDLPHLADWYARLRTRPGYASQVMIPLI